VVLLAEKKKLVVEEKVVVMHGKFICADKPIRSIMAVPPIGPGIKFDL
jgi:hypothetical protein